MAPLNATFFLMPPNDKSSPIYEISVSTRGCKSTWKKGAKKCAKNGAKKKGAKKMARTLASTSKVDTSVWRHKGTARRLATSLTTWGIGQFSLVLLLSIFSCVFHLQAVFLKVWVRQLLMVNANTVFFIPIYPMSMLGYDLLANSHFPLEANVFVINTIWTW